VTRAANGRSAIFAAGRARGAFLGAAERLVKAAHRGTHARSSIFDDDDGHGAA